MQSPLKQELPDLQSSCAIFYIRTVEEWLKFCKSLEAVITGQNITNGQGMYAITKSLLRDNVLTTFYKAEGLYKPQSEPVYAKAMADLYAHVSTQQAYVIQMCYMHQALSKPMAYNTHTFVARVNKINEWLALFLPRDDTTPQVKLDDDKIMDILEITLPKDWHDKMRHQMFDCAAKGQATFINFCNNIKSLDPTKAKKEEEKAKTKANGKIPKRKKSGNNKSMASLIANIAKRKGANSSRKFCLVHRHCGHMTNECNIMVSTAKCHKANNSTWMGGNSGGNRKSYSK
eukprot:3557794-Ditylum_brightwellii.AAC.1